MQLRTRLVREIEEEAGGVWRLRSSPPLGPAGLVATARVSADPRSGGKAEEEAEGS